MSYEKLGFTKGQVLKAEHLNHIEDGIANASGNTEVIVDYTKVVVGEGIEKTLSHTYDEVRQLILEAKRVTLREEFKIEGNIVDVTWYPLCNMNYVDIRGEGEDVVQFMGLYNGALYSRYLFADNAIVERNATILNDLDIGTPSFIMKSGSGKHFRIEVSDSGEISANEVTDYNF